VDTGHATRIPGLAAAVPVANTAGAFPGSRERSTTIITFLYFRPGTSIGAQTAGGQAYARRYAGAAADHLAGVTGAAPAQDAQGSLILRYLPWVEVATLAAIALIVGWHFRSPGAPLATLLCVAVAYLVAVRVVYYVPFVAAVLLISLGSDYNVFVVGRIFQEARRRPLRDAVALAVPRASRAITTAGLALAAGFGLLALVPLAQFREIAVAMALGIVLDTFVVRSLLVPALVVLFGRVGSWPGRTARPVRRPSGSPAAENLHRTAAYRD
jgi:uncharacterized membrane protein YdfJ with MMPL/SSD domain